MPNILLDLSANTLRQSIEVISKDVSTAIEENREHSLGEADRAITAEDQHNLAGGRHAAQQSQGIS